MRDCVRGRQACIMRILTPRNCETLRGNSQRHGVCTVMSTIEEWCNECAPPRIPQAIKCQVWIDFDGTLTSTDVLDTIIERYSQDESWRNVEQSWCEGRIGSRACLEYEFKLLRITDQELGRELEDVQLDPGAGTLLELLSAQSVPTAILSDGVDWIIEQILHRSGLALPTIRANSARHNGDAIRLICANNNPSCPARSAHCKCVSRDELSAAGRVSIYIGDGRSDLCAARGCPIIFAKGPLAEALTREGKSFRSFDSLHDVHQELLETWSPPPGLHPCEDDSFLAATLNPRTT